MLLNKNKDSLIIDCFAGGGGASVGIEMALGKSVDIAINHDPDAIAMHKENHPDTIHLTEDIFKVNLQKYVKDRHVDLLWASPDCFPAGNLVWTSNGYKNIEDVKCNDYVLTHNGNYKKVYRTIKKNDRKFCNIKIAGCEEFQSTLNHPFLARKKKMYCTHGEHRTTITKLLEPEWINAENLTSEYKVGIPINTKSEIPVWNGIVKCTSNTYGVNNSWIENTLEKYMDNLDFWWLIGRYIGDGYSSIEKCTVDICSNKERKNEIKEVIERLGIKYTEREKKTTHSFIISSKEFCAFVNQFGVGALNKTITPEILNLPIELLQSFLKGYISADGCWENSFQNPRCSCSTISKTLAYGLQQCLLKAYGVYASLCVNDDPNNVIEGCKVKTHKSYNLCFYKNNTKRCQYKIENNIAWVNVKKCEIVNDKQKSIYTLSVEEDESFTINNIAVHNCTSHSKAKGGKPREKGLRILPWAVFKHAKEILPDVIIMENVEEIQQWGPLDKNGYPIKERQGEEYKKFITAMKSLGYIFESRELVAADYGAPTTRKRWYAVFRRDGKPIVWPQPTHNKDGSNGLKKWVPVSTVLDFEDLGKSIFGRKKPLADKTMNRIARGLKKFVFECDEPFVIDVSKPITATNLYTGKTTDDLRPYLVQVNHGGDNFRGQDIDEPMPTITSKHGFGKVTPCVVPFIDKSYGGNYKGFGSSCNEPAHTITTVDHNRMVAPMLIQYHSETTKDEVRGQKVSDPIQTIDTSNRYALVSSFISKFYKSGTGQSVLEPLHTITTSAGHFGQVNILTVEKNKLLEYGIDEETAQKCTWVSQFIVEYYGQGTGQSVNEPLHTIVTKDRFALITVLGNEYVILDIFLRMLTPEELKQAQGFPRDYILDFSIDGKPYSKAKQVARIGNSVVPIMAQKLVEANCSYLKVGERVPNLYINDDSPQLSFM